MPRKSTYWKNPDKYRQQASGFHKSKKGHVPKSLGNNTFGIYKKKNNVSGTPSSIPSLDSIKELLEKYYTKRHIPAKLKQMEKLGQVYWCEGYAFMPLSYFKQAYASNLFSSVAPSYVKAQQGIQSFIPYVESCCHSSPSQCYAILTNPVSQRGVDFLILKNGLPHVVIEITNYAQTTFLHSKDVVRYINNLNEWSKKHPNIYKVIVIQHPENLKNNPRYKNAYVNFLKNNIGIKIMR